MKRLIFMLVAVLYVSVGITYVFAADSEEYEFKDGCVERYLGNAEEVVIPTEINGQQVTKIGVSAFSGNVNVKTVFIPSTVTQIWEDNLGDYDSYPFLNTPALEAINVDENNPVFKDIDGVLVSKEDGVLLHYPQNKSGENYVIPDEVKEVRTLAIYNYNNLKQIYVYNDDVGFTVFSVGYGDIIINCHKNSLTESCMKDSFDVLYIVDVGDVDGSGVITAADAAMLLAKVLEGNDIDSNDMNISDYFDVCDVNKDGILTASDAAEILNKTLQIG
jgi:hypothetical protein